MVQDPLLNQYSKPRKFQRFMLALIYFDLGGENWIHNDKWLSYDVSECLWFNQKSSLQIGGWHKELEAEPLCDENSNLLVLNLTSNNLNGTFPNLAHGINGATKILDVSNNGIEGRMPSVTSVYQNLEVFSLANNKFEGLLTGGGGLPPFNARVVKLDGNQLLGFVPSICHLMPHLEELDLRGNLFDGIVTHEFHYCKNLTRLILTDNLFGGSLPSELGLLTNLKELDVTGNAMMTGTIPPEYGVLPNLQELGVDRTNIVGHVPEALCQKVELLSLNINANCSSMDCCK